MKILLTGSEGFIGSAIRRALEQSGDEVISVDLLLPQAHADTTPPEDTHRLDVRQADESSAWASLLMGVDVVCHQAALVGVEPGASDLPHYASHNDIGTAALLAAMARASVGHLILASSMVVYGEGRYSCIDHGPQRASSRKEQDLASGRFEVPCWQCGGPMDWLPVDETAPLEPRSGYAASKAAQEHYAAAWARHTGGRAIALRYHNVYGAGMPRDTSYCGVAAMFRSALERGDRPRVFEDGAQTRDFVHVNDVATANLLALRSVHAHPPQALSTYNIASGTPVTIREVADALAADTNHPPTVTGHYRAGDVRHIIASPDRAASELGFRAQIRPEVGLRDFASAPLRPTGQVSA